MVEAYTNILVGYLGSGLLSTTYNTIQIAQKCNNFGSKCGDSGKDTVRVCGAKSGGGGGVASCSFDGRLEVVNSNSKGERLKEAASVGASVTGQGGYIRADGSDVGQNRADGSLGLCDGAR